MDRKDERLNEMMQANRMGITITELRRRRKAASDAIAGEAGRAYAKALAKHLTGKPASPLIARAILAERERCAKIAEDEDGNLPRWGEDRNQRTADKTKAEIAAAIRADREG